MNTTVPALQAHSVDAGVITESVFLCILAIVIIFGNVLVCIAFYRDRKLRTTTNCFLVSLAIADIAVGSFSLPYWIYFRIGEFDLHEKENVILADTSILFSQRALESVMYLLVRYSTQNSCENRRLLKLFYRLRETNNATI